jgi:hypothetical protein
LLPEYTQALGGLRLRNPTKPWASIALSQVTYIVVKTADIVGAIVIGGTTMVPMLVLMHAIGRHSAETRFSSPRKQLAAASRIP